MIQYSIYVLKEPDLLIPKYIGITNNVQRRFKEHMNDPHFTKKTKWISELKSKGKQPLIEVLLTTNVVREAIQKEIEFIEFYSKHYVLVNSTSGGEYKLPSPIDVYSLDGIYISSYDSMTEYCEMHGLSNRYSSSISRVCSRQRNYFLNRIFRYAGDPVTVEDLSRLTLSIKNNTFGINKKKEVFVFNLEGELLGHFSSINEASKAGFGSPIEIGEALSSTKTRRCSAHGYLFCQHKEDFDRVCHSYLEGTQNKNSAKWICQYDLEGNFISRYKSMLAAAKAMGKTSVNSIKRCLKNETGKAYNYMWRYSNTKDSIVPYKNPYNRHLYSKPVNQYSLQGELIAHYSSCQEAAEAVGGKGKYIGSVASGNCNKACYAYGYIWKYNGGRLVKRLTL